MLKFSELLEAKVERQLTSMSPKAPAEQHFADIHTVKSVSDKFLVPNNGVFDAAKKVKTFERKKNHFGNDEIESIKKYDENISLADRVINAHKKKKVRHLYDKDGKYVDTDLNSSRNKEALASYAKRAVAKKHKLAVVKESKKDVFAVGDNVHMGLRVKGGAGFRGKVTKIHEDGNIEIERPKDALDKWYPKTYKGHKTLCTKEEVVSEISKDTLGSYIKKASQDNLMKGYHAGYFGANRENEEKKRSPTIDDKERKDRFEMLQKGNLKKVSKRREGIGRAVDRLTQEAESHKAKDTEKAEKELQHLEREVSKLKKKKKSIKEYVNSDNPYERAKDLEHAADVQEKDPSVKVSARWRDVNFLRNQAKLIRSRAKRTGVQEDVVSEKLNSSATVKDWIDDFQNSVDPKFEGKSKEKRREMAIAAYYAKQNEEVEMINAVVAEVSKDTLKNFADSSGKMKHDSSKIDSKNDKIDKVKEFIKKKREEK